MDTEQTMDFETMITQNNWVILDTETTGLMYPAEICQIAIIDPKGDILLYEDVRPIGGIPIGATKVHGITNEKVAGARGWREVWPDVQKVLTGKDLIIYNYDYDSKLMQWSCKLSGTAYSEPWNSGWCAMLWYAGIYNEVDEYYGTPRWQKLGLVAAQQKIIVKDAHDSLGDCQMTLGLVDKLARKTIL